MSAQDGHESNDQRRAEREQCAKGTAERRPSFASSGRRQDRRQRRIHDRSIINRTRRFRRGWNVDVRRVFFVRRHRRRWHCWNGLPRRPKGQRMRRRRRRRRRSIHNARLRTFEQETRHTAACLATLYRRASLRHDGLLDDVKLDKATRSAGVDTRASRRHMPFAKRCGPPPPRRRRHTSNNRPGRLNRMPSCTTRLASPRLSRAHPR